MPDKQTSHHPIAESTCFAATLISAPGTFAYLLLIIWLQMAQVDLSNNLVLPLLLATAGLAVFLLALIGLVTGLVLKFQSKKSLPVHTLCLWVNTLALLSLVALILLTPQFE